RRRHTRLDCDWSSDVCSSDLLAQNDDLLNRRDRLREAEGDAAERMQQIAREAYVHTESNLYAVSPEKSHVSKEFAAGDPKFWTRSEERRVGKECRCRGEGDE